LELPIRETTLADRSIIADFNSKLADETESRVLDRDTLQPVSTVRRNAVDEKFSAMFGYVKSMVKADREPSGIARALKSAIDRRKISSEVAA
jgi:hypothetical protein